jgi:hypothetical protein
MLWSFSLFDRLLRTLVSNYPSQWENLGRPPGFLWVPKGSNLWEGSYARAEILSHWMARPPKWLGESIRSQSLYVRLKTATKLTRFFLGLFLVELFALTLSVFTGMFG